MSQHQELLPSKASLLAVAKSHPDFSSIARAWCALRLCSAIQTTLKQSAWLATQAQQLMLTFGRAYLAAEQRDLTLKEGTILA